MAKNLEPIKSKNFAIGEHWAIIIDISNYLYSNLNLKYAHRDAEEIYTLLVESKGGFFKKNHVVKLINEEASQSKIIKALRNFLKKPDKDDLVLIYFSCHGAYDPDRPKNSYIIPYDTDPDDIASTAVPMREIQDSIRENLISQKIVIIADACHSAAIGDSGRRNINSTPIINQYLQKLAESVPGTAFFTSAEANEVALEDEKWGGGHGVFTHFLLEGLRGNADGYGGGKEDGIISIGELFEYVRENVKQNTDNRQHPSMGSSRYDRNLPLKISKNFNDSNKITDMESSKTLSQLFKSFEGRELLFNETNEEIKFVILTKVYLVSKGYHNFYIPFWQFLESLSSNKEEHEKLREYFMILSKKNFIESKALGTISITHTGIKKIERLIEIVDSITRNEIDSIHKIQKLRYDILKKAYDISPHKREIFNIFTIGQPLGIEKEKLERIFYYLEHDGLIYFHALGGDFYITDKGKEVIKKNRLNRIF